MMNMKLFNQKKRCRKQNQRPALEIGGEKLNNIKSVAHSNSVSTTYQLEGKYFVKNLKYSILILRNLLAFLSHIQ